MFRLYSIQDVDLFDEYFHLLYERNERNERNERSKSTADRAVQILSGAGMLADTSFIRLSYGNYRHTIQGVRSISLDKIPFLEIYCIMRDSMKDIALENLPRVVEVLRFFSYSTYAQQAIYKIAGETKVSRLANYMQKRANKDD
jgi:predicted transcriptional regulator